MSDTSTTWLHTIFVFFMNTCYSVLRKKEGEEISIYYYCTTSRFYSTFYSYFFTYWNLLRLNYCKEKTYQIKDTRKLSEVRNWFRDWGSTYHHLYLRLLVRVVRNWSAGSIVGILDLGSYWARTIVAPDGVDACTLNARIYRWVITLIDVCSNK